MQCRPRVLTPAGARALLLAATLVAGAGGVVARGAAAQVVDSSTPGPQNPPPVVQEAQIVERLGQRVDPATALVDEAGRPVRVGDLLGQDKPVVLAFVYHTCPMLCSLILDGYADALAETDLVAGRDFIPVAVSFDERDTPAAAAAAKAKYVAEVGKPELEGAWRFLTGPEAEVRRLADDVGFGFEWDVATNQYAHNAALILLSPDGTVTRYLYGISYPARDFRLAVVEAGAGRVGSSLDRLLLTCFQYDKDARSYTPYVMGIMKLGGGLLLVALAAVLGPLWRRERRRNRAALDGAAPAGPPSGAVSSPL